MELSRFQRLNEQRAKRWHNGDSSQWNLLEWTAAMCGEAGEAANVAKKIRRLDLHLPNKEAGIDKSDLAKLKHHLANECADTIIYALIIMSELGVDASESVREVFNKKSEEYGFPEKI